jgi:hypothetical protein
MSGRANRLTAMAVSHEAILIKEHQRLANIVYSYRRSANAFTSTHGREAARLEKIKIDAINVRHCPPHQ